MNGEQEADNAYLRRREVLMAGASVLVTAGLSQTAGISTPGFASAAAATADAKPNIVFHPRGRLGLEGHRLS
jgi:hypothetical protein